jgi:hypothetical protein
MSLAAEKELEHIGETHGVADHDHDLIHDLSKRLDALWRTTSTSPMQRASPLCRIYGAT